MLRGIAAYVRRHHIALLALFFALGGTAFAAGNALLPKNSVGTAQLKNGAVVKTKIAKKTLAQLKGNKGAQGIQGPAGPFPDGDLPAGKTIRGTYQLFGHASTVGEWTYGAISFGYRLAA